MARFLLKRKKNEIVLAEIWHNCIRIQEKTLSLQRLGGEIPSRRCISFYFALYRSDVGNLIGNSSNEKQGKGQEWHSRQRCSYAHAFGVVAFLYVGRGSDSYVRPLGKVHKDGHAILLFLTFCLYEHHMN